MVELLNSKQVWLLNYQNPLLERLGASFFKNLPKSPGVYWMLDQHGFILYVGKAKNLKNRIQSYRRVKPDQTSRKVVRLVHLIQNIKWEECISETAALLRENELLRTHRPPFNTVNTYPESYYFIGLRSTTRHFEFQLTQNPGVSSQYENFYGAFKGRALIRQGFASLIRLLWAALSFSSESDGRFEYPGVLTRRKIPYRYSILIQSDEILPKMDQFESMIKRFLKGTSQRLLTLLTEEILNRVEIPPFMYQYVQSDLELLEQFFKYGPQRNRRLCRFHRLPNTTIAQDEIDDLLVLYRR